MKVDEDVLFLQTDGEQSLHFHTFDKKYGAFQRGEGWTKYLHHLGFICIDWCTIVNLHKVVVFDSGQRLLVLKTLSGGTVYLPVSESAVKALRTKLGVK